MHMNASLNILYKGVYLNFHTINVFKDTAEHFATTSFDLFGVPNNRVGGRFS